MCNAKVSQAVRAHPRSRGENWPVSGSGSSSRGLIPAHAGKTQVHRQRRARGQAHPRSRGENGSHRRGTVKPKGSSPLTRGKHVRLSPLADDQRLIPAHAGKTAIRAETVDGIRAHPRSRGENASASLWMYGGAGSSPLTRGKLRVHGSDGVGGRLIPAHAGKTRSGQKVP